MAVQHTGNKESKGQGRVRAAGGGPSWLNSLLPQAASAPESMTASMWPWPHATLCTLCASSPLTRSGAGAASTPFAPSCPASFAPHVHSSPSPVSAPSRPYAATVYMLIMLGCT